MSAIWTGQTEGLIDLSHLTVDELGNFLAQNIVDPADATFLTAIPNGFITSAVALSEVYSYTDPEFGEISYYQFFVWRSRRHNDGVIQDTWLSTNNTETFPPIWQTNILPGLPIDQYNNPLGALTFTNPPDPGYYDLYYTNTGGWGVYRGVLPSRPQGSLLPSLTALAILGLFCMMGQPAPTTGRRPRLT